MDKNSLKGMIQSLAQQRMPEIVPAKVIKSSPLRIRLTNETNAVVTEESLIVPSSKMPLSKDEKLYLLSFAGGNIFYVMDRM